MADAKKYVDVGASYKPPVEVKTIDCVRVGADEAFEPKNPDYKFRNLGSESKGEAFREERIRFDSWNSSPIVVSVNSRCGE